MEPAGCDAAAADAEVPLASSLPKSVQRMLRTLSEMREAVGESEDGDNPIERLMPEEALGVLTYIQRCTEGKAPQNVGAGGELRSWVNTCLAFERGRRYLGIPDICLPCPLPPSIDYVGELSYCAPQLFECYCEDLMRLVMYGGPSQEIDRSPYLGLLAWRSDAAAAAWSEPLKLPTHCLLSTPSSTRELVAHDVNDSTETWQKRLPDILASSLATLPWFARSGMSGMLVAGGGAVSLVVEDAKPSDWDIFLVVPSIRSDGSMLTEEERETSGWALVTEIMQGVRRSVAQCPGMSECYTYAGVNKSQSSVIDVLVTRVNFGDSESLDDVDTHMFRGSNVVLRAQIILRLYESPAQVLHGFDVDCCAVLYDGSEVWAASRALRALHQGFLLAEPIRQSPSYEFRLEKYSRRLGMQILVPGMHPVLQEHAKMEVQGIFKLGEIRAFHLNAAWIKRFKTMDMRTLVSKHNGLARLLILKLAVDEDIAPDDLVKVKNNYSWGGSSGQDQTALRMMLGLRYGDSHICMDVARANEQQLSQLRRHSRFITTTPHLQAGHEPLFTGSFQHEPLNDWYHSALSATHQRFTRGNLDLENGAGLWPMVQPRLLDPCISVQEQRVQESRTQLGAAAANLASVPAVSLNQRLASLLGVLGPRVAPVGMQQPTWPSESPDAQVLAQLLLGSRLHARSMEEIEEALSSLEAAPSLHELLSCGVTMCSLFFCLTQLLASKHEVQGLDDLGSRVAQLAVELQKLQSGAADCSLGSSNGQCMPLTVRYSGKSRAVRPQQVLRVWAKRAAGASVTAGTAVAFGAAALFVAGWLAGRRRC